MRNIIANKHKGRQPATHGRGSDCIDLLAISCHEDESIIIKCGYLPFYLGNPSDHQAYYCDIDTKPFLKRQHDVNCVPIVYLDAYHW